MMRIVLFDIPTSKAVGDRRKLALAQELDVLSGTWKAVQLIHVNSLPPEQRNAAAQQASEADGMLVAIAPQGQSGY